MRILIALLLLISTKSFSQQTGSIIPLSFTFIENKGQIIDQNNNLNPSVKYLWTGNGMKVQLKGNSFSYEILTSEKFQAKTPTSLRMKRSEMKQSKRDCFVPRSDGTFDDSTVIYSHRVDIELLNANPNPEVKAEGQKEDYINYYTTGTSEAGVTYVHQFNKITYRNIYPNIDLEFVLDAQNQQPFKYNFIVRPDGRVSDIQLQYNGANSINLTQTSSLNIATAYGNFEESIPRSYVTETGKDLTVYYQQYREGVYGFSIGNYNSQQTLVIDPWCTYFGGALGQSGNAISTDNAINPTVTGETESINNIASSGAFQTIYGGGSDDVFIVKFDKNGNRIWATYFGGNDSDIGYGIATNSSSIYVVGLTYSFNMATSGAFLSTLSANTSFLARFNSNGSRIWSTYFPSLANYCITIDKNGNVLFTGQTGSLTNIATSGTYQTILGGNADAFVEKFDSIGNRIWGTYYGGSDDEWGYSITTDSANNIIISGTTLSNNNIATSGAFQNTNGGSVDVFIAKFHSNGTIIWGTYYGGNFDDEGVAIVATDISGNIFVAGNGATPNYFATLGAFQPTIAGLGDCFLAKFDVSGNRIWGTYFGGSEFDEVRAISMDIKGNVLIAGSTYSYNNISTTGAFQTNYVDSGDVFIEKFSGNGNRVWGSYFGGFGFDIAYGITTDVNCSIFITGFTTSKTGISTLSAYQTYLAGSIGDAYIAYFDSTGHFTTGIGEVNPKISLINVYPNPACENINITLQINKAVKGEIIIIDILGKMVKSIATNTINTNVDVKELPSGVYMIEYKDDEYCETIKFVKE